MMAALQYSAKAFYQLAGFVSGKPVSSSLWKALAMNVISCTQPTRRGQRGGTMLCRPIHVVLSGFRRVQYVNTTVDKVRHCNDNCVNLNNMTHTQVRHTRTLGSNMQHDVHVSRNGANYNNLINVQSNKWDLPTIINTNIQGALASKIDEIKVVKDNY